jgi:DNA replication protein DnaC
MNTFNTVEKMKAMRMNSMADIYHQSLTQNVYQQMNQDEFTALMIDTEWEDRQHRKIARLITNAHFQTNASAADIDYKSARKLDKMVAQRLLSLVFMKSNENIIITGPTGVGKSYLAQALGHQACQMLHTTRYFVTSRFFDEARLAKLEGTYLKMIKQLAQVNLLIIDDFGLSSIDKTDRQVLLEIIEERHQKQSTIISSQIPVSAWHDLIGEGTIADAILDRLVYSSHRIELQGESLRSKQQLSE